MNRFKIGDKVKRIDFSNGDIIAGEVYEVSKVSENGQLIAVKGGQELCEYLSKNFVLLEGKENLKIIVGDKVRLKSGVICCGLNHMTQYTVERVRCNSVGLEGKDGVYDESIFNIVKSNRELSCEILTPLQAAEAILNEEDLLYLNYLGNWVDMGKCLNYSLDFLSKEKIKLKPKTIIINGVEVPAPLTRKPDQEFVYFINVFKNRVYKLPTEKLTFNHKNYWSTKEDAQEVLDAMLIPFNNLVKG